MKKVYSLMITSEHPVIKGHLVHGQPLLPGLAYIDMLYQLAGNALGIDFRKHSLKRLSISNPLIVTQERPVNLRFSFEKLSSFWKITVSGTETGQVIHPPKQEKLYITAELHEKTTNPGLQINIEDIKQSATKCVDIETVYTAARKRGLTHQGMVKARGNIYLTGSGCLINIKIDDTCLADAPKYLIHPALVDGAAIASETLGDTDGIEKFEDLYLPLYYELFFCTETLNNRCYAWVDNSSLRLVNDIRSLDISFFNDLGNQIGELRGITAKRVRFEEQINSNIRIESISSSLLELPVVDGEFSKNRVENKNKSTVARENIETLLLQIFSKYLNLENLPVDLDIGFYELGLESSQLLAIVREIESIFNLTLTPTLLFEYTTITQLATYFEENKVIPFPSVFQRTIQLNSNDEKTSLIQDIAIIGMAGRFPKAENIQEFWVNLKAGKNCISEIPKSRWDWQHFEGFTSPSGKNVSKWGGFIDDPDCFDPKFFKISPREAEILDPQERLFLETCWEAIEDAGYKPKTLVMPRGSNNRRHVGVFAGVMHKDYTLIAAEAMSQGQYFPLSLNYASIANRVSYFCNFHGPSIAVDTVCSSSLTSLHLALESIRHGESEVALAGGVNLSLHPGKYLTYGMSGMHSSDGYCHTFGKGGDGYVSGEGVGAVLLKPLYKAMQDNDHIYAVIKGSAVNHVGTASGFTVPSPVAQSDVIMECLQKTGTDPRTISYVEAHGTGTSLGDPIEIQGLVKAFSKYTNDLQYCSIGSVKSNIGHTESAAGICGLIKVVLQLYYKTLVPSLHSEELNPHIDFKNTPFYVQDITDVWKQPIIMQKHEKISCPRRAGLSSFGATGSNAHIIVEEYISAQREEPTYSVINSEDKPMIIPISAKNDERLHAYVNKLLDFLKVLSQDKKLAGDPEEQKTNKRIIVQDQIRRYLAEIIGVTDEAIEVDRQLSEYGVVAVHMMQLKEKIGEELKIEISFNELVKTSTISQVVDYLMLCHQEAIEPQKYMCTQCETEACSRIDELQNLSDIKKVSLSELAYTLQVGREAMEERVAFIVDSIPGLIDKLETYSKSKEKANSMWRGSLRQSKNPIGFLSTDQDSLDPINRWFLSGDFGKIAELWVNGCEIDWEQLYEQNKPQRVSLPTYPFARERYWVPQGSGDYSRIGTGNVERGLPQLLHIDAQETAKPGNGILFDTVMNKTEAPSKELAYLPMWEEDHVPVVGWPANHRTVLVVYSESPFKFDKTVHDYYIREKATENVIQIQLTTETKQVSEREWKCNINDPCGFKTCLEHYASIDSLFFISDCRDKQQDVCFTDLLQSQNSNEIQLLRLIKYLKLRSAFNNLLDCYIITQDNYRINDTNHNPYGGGITGLAYAIAQGEYKFLVRNIDISVEDLLTQEKRDRLLELIINERPSERGDLTKFKDGIRYKQVFLKINSEHLGKSPELKQGGVYIILGGSGTVGGVITRYLIQEYRARIVWIGRQPESSDAVRKKLDAVREWGEPPLYIQADVTSPGEMIDAVKKIKQHYSIINGAIFSGLVIKFDNSIGTTDEEEFQDILNVKTIGSLNFFTSLRDEPLDFMCYFSSGQAFSFSGAANLSAYASGITFSDTFVQYIRGISKFPVGVINWGFWKSSLGESGSETLAIKNIGFLEDNEGFDNFKRFVGLLQSDTLHQLLCLKPTKPVLESMRCKETEFVSVCEKGTGSVISSLWNKLTVKGVDPGTLVKDINFKVFDEWMCKLLFVQMRKLDIFHESCLPDDMSILRHKAGIIGKYDRWLKQCLEILEKSGYINCHAGQIDVLMIPELKDEEKVWSQWESVKNLYLNNNELKTQVAVADACLRKLPEILRGNMAATDVLFSNSFTDTVEGIYKGNLLADYFNSIVADAATEIVRQRTMADPTIKVRIIEAGAGTGGTSEMIFARLKPYERYIEYCFTDISKAFLLNAEEKYGSDNPYLQYKLWDIEKPLIGQGIEIGDYDIVIATNVLHATKNIRQTIRNTKAALKTNGVLLLNEGIQANIFLTLTFGLLDGWWLYEDERLRIKGSPFLASATWQKVLEEEGLRNIYFPAELLNRLGQQVIVAESDGVVRQDTRISATPKERKSVKEQPRPVREETISTIPVPVSEISEETIREYVERVVLKQLAVSLKTSKDDIDSNRPFSDFGVDSIIGVSFVKQLNQKLGVNLNNAILYDYTTVSRLTGYILQMYRNQIIKHMALSSQQDLTITDGVFNSDSGFTEKEYPSDKVKNDKLSLTAENQAGFTMIQPNIPRHTDIAVIGMSGQFPDAEDVDTFWRNLICQHDAVHELPSWYLDQSRYFSPQKQPGKTYCKWGGILENRDCFDPLFFNISPLEAESMNPHQRLVLQESWKALEDAGINPKELADSQVGIFIGAEPNGYFYESFTGASDAIIASRLSYYLDLKGPAIVINTGCSSSGAAIHLACESLRNGESSVAIAGGVNAKLDQATLITLSETDMLSPTGRCHTLDESADGTVFSEGVGIVVLKRLNDAMAEEDYIYGVIRGSGMNQDGASNGITAPNGVAQERLINSIYNRYNIDPEEITYIEAHGTGTMLGDPVEANALVRAFKQFTNKKHYCAVGSAKSHIGHTGASAGVIGLIKVLLSLNHRKIPGLINFKNLNPLIEFKDSAFYVNTESTEFSPNDKKALTAAISTFGHSGTNVHIVVQEFIRPDKASWNSVTSVNAGNSYLIPVSAKNEERLKEYVGKFVNFLRNRLTGQLGTEDSLFNLAAIAYTLQVGREAMEERIVFKVKDIQELIIKMESYLQGNGAIDNCWQGQARQSKELSRNFNQDKYIKDGTGNLPGDHNLDQLADLWTQGYAIDWKKHYKEDKPVRVPVPTYPFAQERYWKPEDKMGLACGTSSAVSCSIHPLVHQNTSDLSEQRYSSTFTGQEFFLADHVVNGQRILPGVAYLEMARVALDLAVPVLKRGHTLIALNDVIWIRPIVVENEPIRVHIGIYPEDSGEIAFEIYSESDDENTEPTVHCQGTASLRPDIKSQALDLNTIQNQCSDINLSSSQCYEIFRKMGIDYGPSHQGIENVFLSPGQVLAKLSLPPSVIATEDQFVLHPSLMDSATQASIGLKIDFRNIESLSSKEAVKPILPFSLEEIIITGNCTSTMWSLIRYSDGSKAGDKVEKLDIDLCDDNGNIHVRMRGFSSRVLEGELHTDSEPDELISQPPNQSAGTIMMAPIWNSVIPKSVPAIPSDSNKIVVVCEINDIKKDILQYCPKAQVLQIHSQDTIEEITEKLEMPGCIDHIIWVAPDTYLESVVDEALIEDQTKGVIQVFRMVKALLKLGYDTRDLEWTVITIQTQLVRKNDIVNPTYASIHGLVGSMAKEYPNWKCRIIDMENNCDWPIAQMFTLSPDPQGNTWAFRRQEWYTQKLVPVQFPPMNQTFYKPGGVYVVIGGTGGIGTAWSEYMIRTYQARIILIGRREKNADIQFQLDKLAALGLAPDYISADATDQNSLHQAYKMIKEKYSQINGVIHSAIVLLDKSLANMDEERFIGGLSAKVDISVRMAQVFQKEPLDFVIFFSGIMAFVKTPGQSNYAAGCTFKDAFAYRLSHEWPCAVKIMNWGYWGSVGVVASKEYQERMAQAGVGSIEPPEAMEALEVLLAGPVNQIALVKTIKPLALK